MVTFMVFLRVWETGLLEEDSFIKQSFFTDEVFLQVVLNIIGLCLLLDLEIVFHYKFI